MNNKNSLGERIDNFLLDKGIIIDIHSEYHKTLVKVYNFNYSPKTYYDYDHTEVMVEIPSYKKHYNEKLCEDIDISCSNFKREFIDSIYEKFNNTADEYVDIYVYATLPTGYTKDLKFKSDDEGFIISQFA